MMVEQAERRKWDPVTDKRGLECRSCGCKHFEVLYTRATWGGRIMRRRACRHCGKRMTTWESASCR
ncbi:MAG: Transcriptional repressor NrdR [Planctomycetes bacterium ADurb.Bin126]|nr:MAG: Transcriptional repressor NrdR [Planctomycetes bacterium ADurb.Bin126]